MLVWLLLVPDPVDLKSVRIGVLAPEKNPEGLQLRNNDDWIQSSIVNRQSSI